jgi:hypothetical protein
MDLLGGMEVRRGAIIPDILQLFTDITNGFDVELSGWDVP